MKGLQNILLAALTAVAGTLCARGATPSGPYITVWEDNFDGPELDRAVWNVEVNGSGCGNHELEYYIDSTANVCVRDGALVLTARRTPYGESHSFTSGRVNTRGKKTFTYGIVEASIKLPKTANGLWPAFWMMGDIIGETGWPACGEIDVLEMGHSDGIAAGTPERTFNGALHFGPDHAGHKQVVGFADCPFSLQDERFHTYRCVWTPERIEMFVDEESAPYLSVDIAPTDDAEAPGRYFHTPHFLLFNLAIGGDYPGIFEPSGITALPEVGASAEMLVDYVRVLAPALSAE